MAFRMTSNQPVEDQRSEGDQSHLRDAVSRRETKLARHRRTRYGVNISSKAACAGTEIARRLT